MFSIVKEYDTKAVIMGNRRTDPYSSDLSLITPSSEGWAPFFRINPLLDWSYKDIWDFIMLFNLPYCPLYDKGYTSLGGISNTLPNQELIKEDGTYLPARYLNDESKERCGRIKK